MSGKRVRVRAELLSVCIALALAACGNAGTTKKAQPDALLQIESQNIQAESVITTSFQNERSASALTRAAQETASTGTTPLTTAVASTRLATTTAAATTTTAETLAVLETTSVETAVVTETTVLESTAELTTATTPAPPASTTTAELETSTTTAETQDPDDEIRAYVLNTNTRKFHEPGCKSAALIKDKNRKDVEDSWNHIIEMGYQPCKNCH